VAGSWLGSKNLFVGGRLIVRRTIGQTIQVSWETHLDTLTLIVSH
jgi:hypothetical protein